METNGTQTDLHDRGVGELVKELSAQVSTLVRQEVDLAKVELADKGKRPGAEPACTGRRASRPS
jgi:uncharacterized membrane protein YqjE